MSNEYVCTVYMLIVFGYNACITIAIITNNTYMISLFIQHKFALATLLQLLVIVGDSSLERNWQDVNVASFNCFISQWWSLTWLFGWLP